MKSIPLNLCSTRIFLARESNDSREMIRNRSIFLYIHFVPIFVINMLVILKSQIDRKEEKRKKETRKKAIEKEKASNERNDNIKYHEKFS